MADVVKRIEYYYTVVPDRAGAGARVLNALKAARVSISSHSLASLAVPAALSSTSFHPMNAPFERQRVKQASS